MPPLDTYQPFDGSEITDLIVDLAFSEYNGVMYFQVIYESGWKYEYLVLYGLEKKNNLMISV